MKIIFILFTALNLSFLSTQAMSIPITVGGQDYDVSTIVTTIDTSRTLLVSQVWWDNNVLAAMFADTLGAQLGLPNLSSVYGPIFLYRQEAPGAFSATAYNTASEPLVGFDPFQQYTYATATLSAVPEPSIIALFAAGLLGIGFARRRQS